MSGSLISHSDRQFLDRICTHLVVFEGDSVAKMYVGN
jgi:ATPase subunit of ABC transporter with duplicated ATPase domains